MTAFAPIHAVANPAGPIADEISGLWWLLLGLGGACYLLVVALVIVALIRRRPEESNPQTNNEVSTRRARPPVPERDARRWIVVGGVILPAVVLVAALTASVAAIRRIPASAPPGSLSIEVTGHQWWWSVRYPERGSTGQFTVANEIHIPVGEPVQLTLSSVDVIHSFWVPELAGKIDVLPDYTTTLVIEADEPGEYRGRCAEFCGLQHAKMNMLVIAQLPAEFKAWVEGQQQAGRRPATPETQRGQQVFLRGKCVDCHDVRGTTTSARRVERGPDLTHLASRRTIAAATLTNTVEHLSRWLRDPDSIKEGTTMRATRLSDDDHAALLAYLESLK